MKPIKTCLIIALAIVIFGLTVSPSYAGSFFDNFDDGNADGWWLGYSMAFPSIYGNWRVENGTLVQDTGYDGVIALVENNQFSDQTVEVELKLNGPSGYCGIIIWFQNKNNMVSVGVRNGVIGVSELIDNIGSGTEYQYNFNINENRWVNLKVDASNTSEDLNIYADGVYLFTHHLTTSHRTGQSGVFNGNAGGYFDNFKITSDDIPPISVNIDIRPWSKHNLVQSKGYGILPVAIFSTEYFDAPNQIDQKTLTFGASGDEQSLAFCNRRPRDVSRDGSRDDLICYFFTKKARFQCGDTEGTLKGKTISGVSIEGRDAIKVIRCK